MHHHAISDHTPRPFPTIFDRQQANSGTTLRAALVYLAAIVPKLMHWDSGKPCRLNSASATTAQQLRFSNHASATTDQQLRFSNHDSATTAQQPRLSNQTHASATSHLTRHIKIPPPLASTCKVTSYTSYQNPTPSGKYMHSLILHVYGSWFTKHSLRAMFYESWFTNHGLRAMVYESWFTNHGLRAMVYESWFTNHGLRAMVYESWFTKHSLRAMVYESWFTKHSLRAMVYRSRSQPRAAIRCRTVCASTCRSFIISAVLTSLSLTISRLPEDGYDFRETCKGN